MQKDKTSKESKNSQNSEVPAAQKPPGTSFTMDFGLEGDRIYLKLGHKLFLFIFVFMCVVGVSGLFWTFVYYLLLTKTIPAISTFVYENWNDIRTGKIFFKFLDWVLSLLRSLNEKASKEEQAQPRYID